MSTVREVQVRADGEGLGDAQLVGTLKVESLRGREVFAFEYADSWLQRGPALALDPALALVGRAHTPAPVEASQGVFLDSAPGAWGRHIMQRLEALEARREGREGRQLLDSDYLFGVHDLHRAGALRFGVGGLQIDDHVECVAPHWKVLRALENASRKLESTEPGQTVEESLWLRVLAAPGASTGGARPKACVKDPQGNPWIAKFPSTGDTFDVGAWEFVVRELGHRAGLAMAEARLEKFGSLHRTFLSKRFDRTPGGGRKHMASAMMLLGKADARTGAHGAAAASYLDLAALIQRQGSEPDRDLRELWRRIAFSVAVSNTDDHLKNHAFLLEPSGWRLAPAFDVNPNPSGSRLTLNITEHDNARSWELVRDVAPIFRVKGDRVEKEIQLVVAAVSTWREVAAGLGLGAQEIESMEAAFSRVRRPQRTSGLRRALNVLARH